MGLTPFREAFSFLWEASSGIIHQWWDNQCQHSSHVFASPAAYAFVCGPCTFSWSTAKLVVLLVHSEQFSQSSLDCESRLTFCWCLFGCRRLPERFCLFSVLWKWLTTQAKATTKELYWRLALQSSGLITLCPSSVKQSKWKIFEEIMKGGYVFRLCGEYQGNNLVICVNWCKLPFLFTEQSVSFQWW